MRPKSGLPKLKARRAVPQFEHGFRGNPATASYRHPQVGGEAVPVGNVSVISLFSGCGGLDLGFLGGFTYLSQLFAPLPFRIVAAYDNDSRAVQTYRLNLLDDIHEVDLANVDMSEVPPSDLLIGGFPCQDFSSSGHKLGLSGSRGRLYRVFTAYMKAHRPRVVVAENVPHLAKMGNGIILEEILHEFEDVGYDFRVWKLSCPDFGLPQSRHRLFMVGVRRDLPGAPTPPVPDFRSRHRTIESAIGDLENVSDESIPNQSQYFVATKATAGAGQGDQDNVRGTLAYCIRANAKARIQFHYGLSRRLTVRECARLQSFPDEFVFPQAAMNNMTQIGNAVPPIVGHHVARSIAEYFASIGTGRDLGTSGRSLRPIQLSLLTGCQ